MGLYKLLTNIKTIGIEVKNFPLGIKDAFDSLERNLGNKRAYYGISWMNEKEEVVYYAMAEEINPSENLLYQYEVLTLEKGDYRW